MTPVTINLLKPGSRPPITYRAELLLAEPGHLLVHARWERPDIDLGYVTFVTGDHFLEHFYTERWYTIFELRSPQGTLKGWYCNIARPAQYADQTIASEDLELDLFVSADRSRILTLDQDEFAARCFERSDPPTHAAALAALAALTAQARAGLPPFDGASPTLLRHVMHGGAAGAAM